MKHLPNKPSKLIDLAVKDMKATIKQGHAIMMSTWGTNVTKSQCSVCMAGAVMLQSGVPINEFSHEVDKGHNANKLLFLDNIRIGNLRGAMNILDIKLDNNKYHSFADEIEGWELWGNTDPKVFYKQCKDLSAYLESVDL